MHETFESQRGCIGGVRVEGWWVMVMVVAGGDACVCVRAHIAVLKRMLLSF